MRVLFTAPALFGQEGVYGGAERYALELARAVAARLGGATLLVPGSRNERRRDGELEILVRRVRLYARGQRHNPVPKGLWSAVGRADVVHCHQRHLVMTSLAIVLARLRGVPAFVTDHGGGGWDLSAYLDTTRWCAGLLHVSRFARGMARRDAHPEDRILYGGVAGPGTGVASGDAVLYVGRLLPHKGADVLLDAVRPGWRTVICGAPLDGRYLADLRSLAAGKAVEFRLSATDAELDEAYGRAAVVAVPSVGRDRYGGSTAIPELLGLTAIEAAARGIPVVASDIASLPEVVEDGVTGFLVPPGDAAALRSRIAALLEDPALRQRMGRAARERVAERFTWSRAADEAIAAYRLAGAAAP